MIFSIIVFLPFGSTSFLGASFSHRKAVRMTQFPFVDPYSAQDGDPEDNSKSDFEIDSDRPSSLLDLESRASCGIFSDLEVMDKAASIRDLFLHLKGYVAVLIIFIVVAK